MGLRPSYGDKNPTKKARIAGFYLNDHNLTRDHKARQEVSTRLP